MNSIECDQFIAKPPAAVWRVLTEPELHAKWWVAGDIKPVVGHRFTLDMGAQWGEQQCEVLEVEPEKLLRYTFAEGVLDTTITWRLEPEGQGTRLFLVHDGFPPGAPAIEGMGRGWPGLLRRIDTVLAG
ncbi:SRPBCC domain-containing protein [Actinoplanes sp. LDG1-06]|uniref:SRPBCC domain-containing protein n=1 Tax=Paractinoplanes ovalisporus TaxID=2810368 RepID=A0ABS2ARJ2_9ACTN|nr:SRPBCC domain-containing protein [Actinoplanes ovalisporus]MBM2622487.1 SRPBCC domain-containing protein [Actinoplanes ovalisporus]